MGPATSPLTPFPLSKSPKTITFAQETENPHHSQASYFQSKPMHVIHEAELAEVKLKYQEVKHRLKESLKTNLDLEQQLKTYKMEHERCGMQIQHVQNENAKLKLRIEFLVMQQDAFREEASKTTQLLEKVIRAYKEKLEDTH